MFYSYFIEYDLDNRNARLFSGSYALRRCKFRIDVSDIFAFAFMR